jgi:glycosyltransferase EpsD
MSVVPTNGQYNEHCLPLAHERRIAICSLLPPTLTPPPEITIFSGNGTVRGAVRALREALHDRTYDVVHAHAVAGAALLLVVKSVSARSGANYVFTMQNSFGNYRLRNRLLLYPIFLFFPSLVACSNAVRSSLPRPLRWLSRSKLAVVPNGVDLDRVDHALEGTDGDRVHDDFTVVSVGRLIDIKNLAALIDAFALVGSAGGRLVIVGEGPLRGQLENRVADRGLRGKVNFTGLVGRDDVYRWVATADVVVSVSHGEGMPVAVLEAMACSKPVVLSDIEPHREIARDVDFIPLVHPDDVQGFAREMVRLRMMPPSARLEVGRRCRQLVESRFSIAGMHNSLGKIYDRSRPARSVAGEPS